MIKTRRAKWEEIESGQQRRVWSKSTEALNVPISRGPVVLSAVVAIALIGLNLFLSAQTAREMFARADWVTHTHRVLTESKQLISTVLDAESELRGFLLTNREEYLQSIAQLEGNVERPLSVLSDLVSDNPEQSRRIKEIAELTSGKVSQLTQTLRTARESGVEEAIEIVASGVGRNRMDRLDQAVAGFEEAERELLRSRQTGLDEAYRTTLVSAVGSGLAVLFAIGLHFALSRQQSKRLAQQAEEIHAKSESMRFTLQSIGDGVITTDANGLIVEMNPIAEGLTGWKRSIAQGMKLEDIFHIVNETTREAVDNPAMRALKTGVIVGLANHTVLIRPDGSESPIDDSAAPIKMDDGRIEGSVLVFRDVSKRRAFEAQLQESEQTFRALFDSAPIGIVHTSMDGLLIRVNRRFCEILGMTEEELIGISYREITHPDDLQSNVDLVAPMMSGQQDSFSMNKRYRNHRGETIWANISSRLIRDYYGKPTSIISAVTDISEQRAAEETRIRMSAIVNASNDAIITKDLHGIVMSWNAAATKLFGYGEAEMVGSPIFKVVPEERQSEELDLLRRSSLLEEIEPLRTERLHQNGTRVEVLLKVAPLVDADGTLIGISTIAKDLTAESRAAMELRESEQRFRMLADNMSQFAWMANPEGEVYWYNKRWYDYTGTTIESVRGWGWQQVHHPDHLDRVVQSIQRSWDTGEPWEETFPIRGKDGKYRWFLSRALPIRDANNQITHWFGSNTDIDELIEKEEKLEKARITAENATKARGEFLANMSHEIRTPMTAILGHTEILADHISNPDDLQSVETIQRNGKFLLQIINDILDLSKIDSGKFEIEQIDISPTEVLHEIRSLLDVRAAEKQIDFQVHLDGSIPNTIQTDPIRLRQILVNLVGNAIKFTDNGRVDLHCRYEPGRNIMLFRIVDTGIGIDADVLPNLFQPFVQADASSTRAFEGTGLGLAISKRLAEMLGGTIWVDSRRGEGSIFSLEIDCGRIGEEPWIDEIKPIHSDGKSAKLAKVQGLVLVVDDRRDIRFLAQNFLEKAGASVVLATNGEEAIRMLTSEPFLSQSPVDAVLMDMQMPIMDGYTAAKKLREWGFSKPIIALTANAMKDDRDKCLACGCNDYATKPLDGGALVHLVASYIQEHQL